MNKHFYCLLVMVATVAVSHEAINSTTSMTPTDAVTQDSGTSPTSQPDASTDNSAANSAPPPVNTTPLPVTTSEPLTQLESKLDAKMKMVDKVLDTLGRQIIDLQTFVEERVRSDGQSGIKKTRLVHRGTRSYYTDNHISASAGSAHDHVDYEWVLGLGECTVVLNGVEFRTRHNDYLFRAPSHSSKLDDTEAIPYPTVPPAVSSKPTLQEQVQELREWFKAFKAQDHSVRDYRKYFKPNLCYLEGGWTLSSRDTLQEPFASDRHQLDATSWFDLAEKIRFTSYTGHMNALENFAYLPTTVYNITEDGVPLVAQWNYRIMCHPLKSDLPTNVFVLEDDLPYRLARDVPLNKMADRRAARFRVNEYSYDRSLEHSLMDELMHQIPGKDNYGANISDHVFDLTNFENINHKQNPLNVAYYHRQYKIGRRGAMGNQGHYRGFNDPNLWVAQTTQDKIMPLTVKTCDYNNSCTWNTRRVTYAIPLEVVYTTPLNSWNPYGFHHHSPSVSEKKGRNGRLSRLRAFNGTSFRHYYRTPIVFFHDNFNMSSPPADAMGVLDQQGTVRAVAASGITMVTPDIPGVGKVRTRYPIFPVHSDGSTVGEEYQALKEMVMRMGRYTHLYEEPPLRAQGDSDPSRGATQARVHSFRVQDSAQSSVGLHGHDVFLTEDEFRALQSGLDVKVTTSYDLGHNHELELHMNPTDHNILIKSCDCKSHCWDGHPDTLLEM